MLWLTSDYHLGESRRDPQYPERFNIMGRPFKSAEDMFITLRDRHNEVVTPDDEVIVAGDVLFSGADPIWLESIAEFNGRKTLIRGNHDRVFTDEQFSPYFDKIIPEGEGLELDIEGIPCWVTHYPTSAREDRFNLTGHIHASWKVQLNGLNVGVDVCHFYPMSSKKVPFYFKAIHDFYDNDAWSAYLPANMNYVKTRGLKESRLTDLKR